MNTVTIDSSWISTNGPAPFQLTAPDTVYNLTVDVNVVPTQPTATITRSTLATPSVGTLTTAGTGGTLTAATYYYRVAAANAQGISLASAEKSQVVASGTTNTVTVPWTAVTGATIYKVYGRTTGAELLIGSTTSLTFTDTGSVTPAGALPTVATGAVTSVSVTQGSVFNPLFPPAVTFPVPASGTAATGYCVVNATNGHVSVVVTSAGTSYTGTETPTFSGGRTNYFGEVFQFPNDGTGRDLTNILLVTNGHLIQVDGEEMPQITDGRFYRRTSEYTVRVNTSATPHTFGGTVGSGASNPYGESIVPGPIIDPNHLAETYEAPPLYNESSWADVR